MKKGFTLYEVLISISIFSLIIVLLIGFYGKETKYFNSDKTSDLNDVLYYFEFLDSMRGTDEEFTYLNIDNKISLESKFNKILIIENSNLIINDIELPFIFDHIELKRGFYFIYYSYHDHIFSLMLRKSKL